MEERGEKDCPSTLRYISKLIKVSLSELPTACSTDSTFCGHFQLDCCPLKGVRVYEEF
jgi:hypothetical protein